MLSVLVLVGCDCAGALPSFLTPPTNQVIAQRTDKLLGMKGLSSTKLGLGTKLVPSSNSQFVGVRVHHRLEK